MRNRHPLGNTRGTRGVNQIGDVVELRGHRYRSVRSSVHRAVVNIDHRQPACTDPVHEVGGGHSDNRPGIGQHEIEAGVGHGRVDRYICRTGFQHSEDRHDRLDRPREQQRHPLPRTDTALNEQVRQPVRGRVQPAIRHGAVAETHRDRARVSGDLLCEQSRNRPSRRDRPTQDCPITPFIKLFELMTDVDRRQRSCRVGGHRRQYQFESVRQIASFAAGEELPHSRHAEVEVFILFEEHQTELVHQAGVGCRT
nr:hypothetical protein CPGR_06058 [Mycolicibacter nonchromogenicus]